MRGHDECHEPVPQRHAIPAPGKTRTRTRPRTRNRSDTQTACAAPQIPIRRHTSESTAPTAIRHPPSFSASLFDTMAKNPNSPATTPNMNPQHTTRTSKQRAEIFGRPILTDPSVEPATARVRARTAQSARRCTDPGRVSAHRPNGRRDVDIALRLAPCALRLVLRRPGRAVLRKGGVDAE
jgi:hypothetical protein